MTDDRYISLIHQQIEGTISDADATTLQEWRASDVEHQKLYDEIVRIWQMADEYPDTLDIDMDVSFEKIEAKINQGVPVKRLPSRRPVWISIAAGVALLCSLFYFLPREQTVDSMTIIADHDNQDVTLPDGSTITLRDGSQITYDPVFDKRRVSLLGSAHFDITRDEQRPFLITGERSQVQVLGTRFLYADDGEQLGYVKMISGHVRISVGDESRDLRGTQGITFGRGEISTASNAQSYDWYMPTFSYQTTQVSAVIRDLESYYHVSVDVDQVIAECSFSGVLSGDIAQSLEIIATVYGSSVFYDGKKYLLDGGSCQ